MLYAKCPDCGKLLFKYDSKLVMIFGREIFIKEGQIYLGELLCSCQGGV